MAVEGALGAEVAARLAHKPLPGIPDELTATASCRYPAAGSCGIYSSRHVDFTYDKLGRILTQKTWDRGANPAADTLKFTKTMTWNPDGSPATVAEGTDTLTYLYDTAGRLSQFKRSPTVLTSYTYTPGTSTIATRTDGTQGAVAFTYDWARRQTVIDPPDSYVTGTVTRSYRLDGLLATQAFPSSITETLAYDAAKRPTSISLGAAGSLSQAFDRAGNVVSDGRSLAGISGDPGGNTQTFTYDGLSRLLTSSGLTSSSGSYEYDLDGNRTKRVEGGITTTYTFDRADQSKDQTIGGVSKTFAYDAYGNQTQSADKNNALTTYAYDEASRLTTITPPSGGAITFTMDGLGRHKDRSVAGTGTTDTYAYLDSTETAWQTGQGTPTGALLDADGSRLAVKNGSTVSWLIFDLHGSVTALCTSGGSTITDAYRFDGWGVQVAAYPTSGAATNPWRYRGLLNIGADTGIGALLDMNARDYSPQLGTFTQEDSVQGSAMNPASMNRFLYALANPATLIDPDGHRPPPVCYPECSANSDSSNEIKTWQGNKQKEAQKEVRRQERADQQRADTGCRKSGICADMAGAPPRGYVWSYAVSNGTQMLLPADCHDMPDGSWIGSGCHDSDPRADPLAINSFGVCATVAGGAGGYGSASLCIGVANWDIGLVGSLQGGRTTGATLSGTLGGFISNGTDLHQMSGPGTTAGVSGGEALNLGGDLDVTQSDGYGIFTKHANLGLTLKPGLVPIEAHWTGGASGVLTVGDVLKWLSRG